MRKYFILALALLLTNSAMAVSNQGPDLQGRTLRGLESTFAAANGTGQATTTAQLQGEKVKDVLARALAGTPNTMGNFFSAPGINNISNVTVNNFGNNSGASGGGTGGSGGGGGGSDGGSDDVGNGANDSPFSALGGNQVGNGAATTNATSNAGSKFGVPTKNVGNNAGVTVNTFSIPNSFNPNIVNTEASTLALDPTTPAVASNIGTSFTTKVNQSVGEYAATPPPQINFPNLNNNTGGSGGRSIASSGDAPIPAPSYAGMTPMMAEMYNNAFNRPKAVETKPDVVKPTVVADNKADAKETPDSGGTTKVSDQKRKSPDGQDSEPPPISRVGGASRTNIEADCAEEVIAAIKQLVDMPYWTSVCTYIKNPLSLDCPLKGSVNPKEKANTLLCSESIKVDTSVNGKVKFVVIKALGKEDTAAIIAGFKKYEVNGDLLGPSLPPPILGPDLPHLFGPQLPSKVSVPE